MAINTVSISATQVLWVVTGGRCTSCIAENYIGVESAYTEKQELFGDVCIADLHVLYNRFYMQGPFLLSYSQLLLFHYLLGALSSGKEQLLSHVAL